jgi:ferrous iron transport protein B
MKIVRGIESFLLTLIVETKSVKWATLSVVITLGLAFFVTFATASLARLMGWV